jgi:hypothetical protein
VLILVYGIIVLLALCGCGRKRADNKGLTPEPVVREDKGVQKERARLESDDWSNENDDIVQAIDLVK